MDLALDLDPNSPTYRDIYFTPTNDLATVTERAGILQDVLTAIQVYLGEWFLDQSVGMPYYQVIYVKNADEATVNAAFINQILAVPGVTALTRFSFTPNATNRAPGISFTFDTISGTVDYSGFLSAG